MPVYVYREGRGVVPVEEAGPLPTQPDGRARSHLAAPMVVSDIPEYRSPVGDHKMITSRSERREDLKRNGCVEIDPPAGGRRGYRNPAFAAKRGLGLNPELKDTRARLADEQRPNS